MELRARPRWPRTRTGQGRAGQERGWAGRSEYKVRHSEDISGKIQEKQVASFATEREEKEIGRMGTLTFSVTHSVKIWKRDLKQIRKQPAAWSAARWLNRYFQGYSAGISGCSVFHKWAFLSFKRENVRGVLTGEKGHRRGTRGPERTDWGGPGPAKPVARLGCHRDVHTGSRCL